MNNLFNFHCDVCLGHFDISGFKLDKTRICEDGFNSDLFFNNYTITFSGHFHTRSKLIRNMYSIIYIGSPYHLSRSDINEERGFCILNLDDLSYKFINSKNTIKFIRVKFPDTVYKKNITGNIVDIHVTIDKSYNEAQFQQYVKTVESYKPLYSPNIVITNNNIDSQTIDVTGFGSTLSMIKEYINGLDINNKDKVYYNMEKLYNNTKTTVITD
jgi:DNA repair exonuclease SbcCD nuclease subunit